MSAPSWAVPGAKVVCIAPSQLLAMVEHLGVRDAVVGETYTIRDMIEHRGALGITVKEIVNPISRVWGEEFGFFLERFRPVITRSQEHDVAKFKHLLNTTHIGEDA